MEDRKTEERRKTERRKIDRVKFDSVGVLVVCKTAEKIFVEVENASPLGLGVLLPEGTKDIVGEDVIIVADTLIMYAKVTRMVEQEDGTLKAGIHAQKFTPEVLEYLFTHIG